MKINMHIFLNNGIVHGLSHDVPMGSIMIKFENGSEILCMDFHKMHNQKLNVLCYDPFDKKWKHFCVKNEYTEMLWKYHRKYERKLSCKINCHALMRHDRRHKTGSGGVRLKKWCGEITDYECSKNPFHDFRRVYN